MPLDYPAILNKRFPRRTRAYTQRDIMLYALSLGFGTDPRELKFVYERELVALGSWACVADPLKLKELNLGVDYERVVHGEESLTLFAPVPIAGRLLIDLYVDSVRDLGVGKGAIVALRRVLRDERNGALIAETVTRLFCRGDGGFAVAQTVDGSGQVGSSTHTGNQKHIANLKQTAVPTRLPDFTVEQLIPQDAALLYRLNGDLNPLHADPETAHRAGFERPILHGLATFGVAYRALVIEVGGYDLAPIRTVSARFSAPVYPGETLRTEMWWTGVAVQFRTVAVERTTVVLDHGRAEVVGREPPKRAAGFL